MPSDDWTASRFSTRKKAELTSVLFADLPKTLRLSKVERRGVVTFARDLSLYVAGGRSFICLITNDRELRRLNFDFLGNDFPTDVLSFPAIQQSEELGEMAISMQRAERQAAEFGHRRMQEVRILMLHGVLHLTGLDHEQDKGEMARAECQWRDEFGLPQTLIARNGKRHSSRNGKAARL